MLYCCLYPPESLLIKNRPLISFFFFFHDVDILKHPDQLVLENVLYSETDCFLMIRSELNTLAEDAHW